MAAGDWEVATRQCGERRTDFTDFDIYTAPKDYEQLFLDYFSYACSLVRKLGIRSDKVEDTASEILIRFMERDFLPKFDPGVERQHRGVTYRTSFQKFFAVFVEHYVRGIRDREKRLRHREHLICDMPVPRGNDATQMWIEVHGAPVDGGDVEVLERAVITEVRDYLATVPVRGMRNFLVLYDHVVEQTTNGVAEKVRRENGEWTSTPIVPMPMWKPDRCMIARDMGVSESAVGAMLAELREHVAAALIRLDPARYARFAVGTTA